jgi:phosphoribosylformylglycinamidine synthase
LRIHAPAFPILSTSAQPSPATTRRELPAAWRVEVFRAPDFGDPEGERALAGIAELGVRGIERVRLGHGYLLSPELTRTEVARIAAELLADPVLERTRMAPPSAPFERQGAAGPPGETRVQRVLAMRRPGVMDPVALTVERTLARAGLGRTAEGRPVRVLTYRAWELHGEASRGDVARLATELFANDVVDQVSQGEEALHFELPASAARTDSPLVPLRGADAEELERISREGVLSLTLLEMRAIQEHYRALRREPTACELETLAQTWSEHCKHKTFAGDVDFDGERVDNLFKSTIQAATRELARPWCVSVFHDNAGIVEFEPGWHVCFKVETHNHPSAIDPYGGAGTGLGGVIRDILGVGLGAKPIAGTDAFFVGPLDLREDELPEGALHPRRILRGVVAGVRDYGNRMGIPTVNGGVWSHPGYVGNPLVYCGTVGLLPAGRVEKHVQAGDLIAVVGGRTGRDGIHGATFSSAELHEQSQSASSSAVQIGDPITEKRVLDALLVARDRGLYRAVTDCGAGGLSSAVGEMGRETGARVELERVPLKYPGLSPDEIWISEAQERMVLAVPPQHLAELSAVFAAEDCELAVIGGFTDTHRLELAYAGRSVGELDMHFLHAGTPRPLRRATWRDPQSGRRSPGCPPAGDHRAVLRALLGSPNVASREWIVRQYDHEVQGMSAVKPLVGARSDGPGDAAVLQPLPDSRRGLAIACGACPTYGLLDPSAMAEAAIDEALRNAVAVGADPSRAALLDNFSWGNCERPEQLGALVLAARACHRAALAYGAPFISGKDSLNNEFRAGGRTLSIPPTLLISVIAPVPDVRRAVTMDLKRPGSRIYLMGGTRAELGGSVYLEHLGFAGERAAGRVPRPDLSRAPALLAALHAAIAAGTTLAVHDLSEGGLAVAAAEMAFAGDLGLDIDLARVPTEELPSDCDPDATRLYSESCTRFLVEVAAAQAAAFEEHLVGLPCAAIGEVQAAPRLAVGSGRRALFSAPLEELRSAHQGGFQG